MLCFVPSFEQPQTSEHRSYSRLQAVLMLLTVTGNSNSTNRHSAVCVSSSRQHRVTRAGVRANNGKWGDAACANRNRIIRDEFFGRRQNGNIKTHLKHWLCCKSSGEVFRLLVPGAEGDTGCSPKMEIKINRRITDAPIAKETGGCD